MDKICFVVQQYGEEVNEGSGTHCKALAERMLPYYEVEVLTSTSLKYPYSKYYEPGESTISGVTVRRFDLLRTPDKDKLLALNKKMLDQEEGAHDEWIMERGPFCPDLIKYLKDNADAYKAIIFFDYTTYLSYEGVNLKLPGTILVPLAHDNATIYKPIYRTTFDSAGTILYNTQEEKTLIGKVFGAKEKSSAVTCFGMNLRDDEPVLSDKYKGFNNYIIYAGRVDYNKNFRELNHYYIQYKKTHDTDLKLLVIGQKREGYILEDHKDIEYLGFVSEEDKRALIGNAGCLVQPSRNESLSIVMLEAMAEKTPVIVNGYCEVMVGHCIRSNAGLYYKNYAEFAAELDYLFSHKDEAKIMGENGRKYVAEHYTWDVAVRNLSRLIEKEENA